MKFEKNHILVNNTLSHVNCLFFFFNVFFQYAQFCQSLAGQEFPVNPDIKFPYFPIPKKSENIRLQELKSLGLISKSF